MITLTSAELNAWLAALLWPLSRILGLIAAAPIFGNSAVPPSVKLSVGVMLAAIIAPTLSNFPPVDPMSMAGGLILAQEMLIGLAMGFTMRIVFAAIEMAGEVSSLTMGLGFASFFDPNTAGRSSAVSQMLTFIATMAFLAMNAHLVLLQTLAESFTSMPIAATPISAGAPLELARWGGSIFSTGLQLSLPIVAALLITNVALGILTRAAPQLNLFGVGFPITLTVGFALLAATLPYLNMPIQNWFNKGIETTRAVGRSAAGRAPAAPVPASPAAIVPPPRPTP